MGENLSERLVPESEISIERIAAAVAPERAASVRIKDMDDSERPREKLLEKGIDSLSDDELLAIFFNTGVVGMNVVELSRGLLKKYGSLTALSRASVQELMQNKGIGQAKAIHLAAALGLGKRLAYAKFKETPMDTPRAMADLLGPEMRLLNQESLRVILLSTRLTLISVQEIHLGSVNEVSANVRDILRPIIVQGAYAFGIAHNHPSGDPEPSAADRNFTRRIKEAAELMQLKFLDHIIIGQCGAQYPDGYFSFREHSLV